MSEDSLELEAFSPEESAPGAKPRRVPHMAAASLLSGRSPTRDLIERQRKAKGSDMCIVGMLMHGLLYPCVTNPAPYFD